MAPLLVGIAGLGLFASDGEHVALNRHGYVLSVHAGQFGGHLEGPVGLDDVDGLRQVEVWGEGLQVAPSRGHGEHPAAKLLEEVVHFTDADRRRTASPSAVPQRRRAERAPA